MALTPEEEAALRARVTELEGRVLFLGDARAALKAKADEAEAALTNLLAQTKDDRDFAAMYRTRLLEMRDGAQKREDALRALLQAARARGDGFRGVLRRVRDYALPGAICGLCYQQAHRAECPMPRVLEELAKP